MTAFKCDVCKRYHDGIAETLPFGVVENEYKKKLYFTGSQSYKPQLCVTCESKLVSLVAKFLGVKLKSGAKK